MSGTHWPTVRYSTLYRSAVDWTDELVAGCFQLSNTPPPVNQCALSSTGAAGRTTGSTVCDVTESTRTHTATRPLQPLVHWTKQFSHTSYNLCRCCHDLSKILNYCWQTARRICTNNFCLLTVKWSWAVFQSNTASISCISPVTCSSQVTVRYFTKHWMRIRKAFKELKWPSRSSDMVLLTDRLLFSISLPL